MKAIEYADERVALVERVRPTARGEETLVTVARVGICGTDLGAVQRGNPRFAEGIVIGHELVGIDPRGRRVTVNPLLSCGGCVACAAGQENICQQRAIIGAHVDGVLAEQVVVPRERLVEIPDGVSDAQAALVEPMATSLHARRRIAPLAQVRKVAVIGAGAIGLCLVHVLASEGIHVTVADVDSAKHSAATAVGAEVVVDVLDGSFDAVFDTVGASATRSSAIAATRPGAPTVFVGMHSTSFPVDANDVIVRERVLLGSFAYTHRDFLDAIALVSNADTSWVGEIDVDAAVLALNGERPGPAGTAKLQVVF